MTDEDASYPRNPSRTRFSREELEAARWTKLQDLIADDLEVLFCGINPGLSSAAASHHFATPGNRFWPALYRSGFTATLLSGERDRELLEYGYGVTSLVRRPTKGVSELAPGEYVEGGVRLRRRVLERRPKWLAMLGVMGYRTGFGDKEAAVGLSPDRIGDTRIWILPNPSGLNAHYPPRMLAEEFARFREAAGLPDRSGLFSRRRSTR